MSHDRQALPGNIISESINAGWTCKLCLKLHSIASWLHTHHLGVLGRFVYIANRVITGADIDPQAQVSCAVLIPHTIGIIIGATAIVEKGVIIMPHVVLGSSDPGQPNRRHPHICAGAMLGAGAVILGPITVGTGAVIGANAVVVQDVPSGATVVGVPAKPIR